MLVSTQPFFWEYLIVVTRIFGEAAQAAWEKCNWLIYFRTLLNGHYIRVCVYCCFLQFVTNPHNQSSSLSLWLSVTFSSSLSMHSAQNRTGRTYPLLLPFHTEERSSSHSQTPLLSPPSPRFFMQGIQTWVLVLILISIQNVILSKPLPLPREKGKTLTQRVFSVLLKDKRRKKQSKE